MISRKFLKVKSFIRAVHPHSHHREEKERMLTCNASCQGEEGEGGGESRWGGGADLFRLLSSASVEDPTDPAAPPVEFDSNGNRRAVKLRIVNLQPSGRKGEAGTGGGGVAEGEGVAGKKKMRKKWEEIGVWQSWTDDWKKKKKKTEEEEDGEKEAEEESEGGGEARTTTPNGETERHVQSDWPRWSSRSWCWLTAVLVVVLVG